MKMIFSTAKQLIAALFVALLQLSDAAIALAQEATEDTVAKSATLVPAAVLEAENKRILAIERGVRSTISVFSADGNGGGSGVMVSADGYALTNFHVVQPCGNFMKCSLPDGNLYDAVVVGIDPTGDVALIKLLGRDDFPPATLADSDKVRAGDWCFAVGNPFLLATDFQPTVSYGIVSGVHRYQYPAGTLLEYADCIQTDAAINPGNSGGPLFNSSGELIGVNGRGSFEKRGRVNVGVGYAISINQIKHFMGCLRSGRIVDHATAGFSVATAAEGGVIVSNILESSDAYKRGLRYDDEIIAFGGRTVNSANAFKNILGIFPKGWKVPLTYRNEAGTHDIVVRLTGVHGEEELIGLVQKQVEAEGPKPMPRPMPKPMPGEEKPGAEKPEEKKEAPAPATKPGAPPVSDELKKWFVGRLGYANYHFNKLELDRVWSSATQDCNLAEATGTWKIAGSIEGKGDFLCELSSTKASMTLAGTTIELDLAKDLDEQKGPVGTGGLLVSLYLWRMMLVEGPAKYGEVSYYGTAPDPGFLAENAVMYDVLSAVRNVVESQLQFSPSDGRLTIIESLVDPDADPCRLVMSDYKAAGPMQLPHRLSISTGGVLYGDLVISSFEVSK